MYHGSVCDNNKKILSFLYDPFARCIIYIYLRIQCPENACIAREDIKSQRQDRIDHPYDIVMVKLFEPHTVLPYAQK